MNAPAIIIPPEAEEQANGASRALAFANEIVVDSQEKYELAGGAVRRTAALAKEMDAKRKEMTKPLDDAKKRIMDFFRGPLETLDQAGKVIERKMLAWKAEQDRIRREAEAAAAEAQRKEREKLQRQADAAAKKGQEEKAAALQAAAQAAPVAPVIAVPEAKADGISTRAVWKWEVVDRNAIPREFLIVDEKTVGAVVRARGGDTNIAGIRVWAEETIVKRT